MALVLTLMAISFLVAITVQIATSVNWQTQGAGNLRDSIQLDAMNRSGLSLVRAALEADRLENNFDSSHDSWNLGSGNAAQSIFGSGELHFKIVDLSGLLQVNALVPDEKDQQKFQEKQNKQIDVWKRFLLSGKFAIDDPDQAQELIDAIIDWIDENDDEKDHGAESGFYLSLSPSYRARNAPLTSVEELLLIRGMTKELFYGNEEYSGISAFVTTAGRNGIVNINTGPQEVLMALHEDMSEERSGDLIEFREEEDNRAALGNSEWYKQIVGMDLQDMVDIRSGYFEVLVEAKYNDMVRTGKGILERDNDKGGQRLLYWEVR